MNKNQKNASDIPIIFAKINIIGSIGFLFIDGYIVPAVKVIWLMFSNTNEQK